MSVFIFGFACGVGVSVGMSLLIIYRADKEKAS
jgi:hypothetical protein